MEVAFSLLATSAMVALFVCACRIVRSEESRQKRLYAARVRNWLDGVLEKGSRLVVSIPKMQSLFYKRNATSETAGSATIATLMRHATRTPLTVVHNDSHLSKIYEHKTETALTLAQKRKLSKKKLEEKF